MVMDVSKMKQRIIKLERSVYPNETPKQVSFSTSKRINSDEVDAKQEDTLEETSKFPIDETSLLPVDFL